MANGNGAPSAPPRPGQPGGKPPMKKSTRNWLIIGSVGAAGIVIWYIMRAKSQQGAGTAATDQSIDPATGIPYSQEYSGYGGYGVGGGGVPQQFGYYDPTTGAFISGTGSTGTVIGPGTNASWAQQVEAYLQGVGYDPTAVAAAIGKYLTGQTLSSDQAGIVAAATGFFGNPPQYVPPISQGTPTGNGTGGGSTGWTSFKTLTASKSETLAEFAREHHWTAATLAAVEKIHNLTAGTRLRKGERIVRPVNSSTPQTTPMQ